MLKHKLFKRQRSMRVFQSGVTLIELMVAMIISLIASSGMVLLMANTMGTGTQTIQMTRLTQEMRTAMQLMTRDLRRANSHNAAANCYANINCNPDDTKITAITPVGGTCFQFWFDRTGDGDLDPDGPPGLEIGSFQLFSGNRNGDPVNVMQMTIDDEATDACGTDWGVTFDITDADIVNVTAFTVSNADSYNEIISATHTQDVSKIRLTLTAELQNAPQGIPITKTIEDLIYVRNHVFCPAGVCP